MSKTITIEKDKNPTAYNKAMFQKQLDDQNRILKENEIALDKKDYVVTVVQTGDPVMSSGDYERQVSPRRYYTHASLRELPHIISNMQRSFWVSKSNSLKDDLSNADEIDFEDKLWGINTRVVIEPMSEELEQSYLNASKGNFFVNHRRILAHEQSSKEEGKLIPKENPKSNVN